MRDLDLTTLRLFVAACELRSIARAAEQAHIVASAASKRLARLEDQAGTPLLLRRKHGVEPTMAAQSLLEHARSILATSQLVERDMAAFAKGLRGQVRVFASASALGELLADDVARFLNQQAHRDIQVHMEERVSADIVRGVHEGLASIGVCWDATELGGLASRTYRSDHLAVALHPAHALVRRKRLKLQDTLAYDHVSLPAATAVRHLLQRAAAQVGRSIHYRVLVSSFEAALRVVQANLALSIVPREIAQHYAQHMGLRVVSLDETWAQRRFVICFRSEQALSPPARQLVEHLAARGGDAAAG